VVVSTAWQLLCEQRAGLSHKLPGLPYGLLPPVLALLGITGVRDPSKFVKQVDRQRI